MTAWDRIQSSDADRVRSPEQIAHERRLAQDESGLIEELRRTGFDVEYASELYLKGLDYKRAVPILLKWLPRLTYPPSQESVVRALTIRCARPDAAPALIEMFRSDRVPRSATDPDMLRWTIGSALEIVADQRHIDELLNLAADSSHGSARQMIVRRLGRLRDPRIVPLLEKLLDDRTVFVHALIALGNQKVLAAPLRHKVESFLEHQSANVRRYARRALAKIDTAVEKAKLKTQ